MEKQELGPNQTKWLNELESGAWQQGRYYLKAEGKFCCLGIACELFRGPDTKVVDGETTEYDGCTGEAPEFVVNALRLWSSEGDRAMRSKGTALVELNDTGRTFAEIAEIVRADPHRYFEKPE